MQVTARSLSILTLFLLSVCNQPLMAKESRFEQGLKDFMEGNYQSASQHFEKARKAGINTVSLNYNLGVSYYKLEQYAKAEQAFRKLLRSKDMAPLAAYNIGLIKNKQGKDKQAISWFKRAYKQDQNKKLKHLAWQALGEFSIEVEKPKTTKKSSEVGLRYGFDSNLVDPANPASNTSDNNIQFYGIYSDEIKPSLRLNAIYFNQDYTDIDAYDLQLMALELHKSFQLKDWYTTAGVIYSSSTLGNLDFQDSVGLQLQASHKLDNKNRLKFRYRFEDISSGDRNYLEGNSHKLRVEYRIKSSKSKLLYEHELNDRTDSTTNSYSPTRNGLQYELSGKLISNWNSVFSAKYRISDYPEVAGVSREDSQTTLKLSSDRVINKSVKLFIEFRVTDNQSNISGYEYSRNNLIFGVKTNF